MTLTDAAAQAAIDTACVALRLPTIATHAGALADQAVRAKHTHRAFLAECLASEVDARDEKRRIRLTREARFPRHKLLSEFDTTVSPVPAASIAHLADGAWIDNGTPVVLLGDSGTGKSHLLIGAGIAACEAGRRVRYTTAAALANELAEAADHHVVSKVIGRYARVDLLCLDELGYLHLDARGAELLFQIVTEREERAAIAVASNSPFSEWGTVFTDPRLAAAVVDRITYRAHIIETGTNSYRLAQTKKGTTTT